MREVSAQFNAALLVSHKRATEVTCTPPGGDTIILPWDDCQVTASTGRGTRWTANLKIQPIPGRDLYSEISAPGALFTIRHGIDFGGGNTELVDMGVYEADDTGADVIGGLMVFGVRDLWGRVERCRFTKPYTPPAGTRANTIGTAVQQAVPGTDVDVIANGGSIDGKATWDRDRTQLITDLARDGGLEVGFDGSGRFRIAPPAILDNKSVVYTYKTGEVGTLKTAERKRPLDRLYNTVVVVPADDKQTWAPQLVSITDPDHPLHPDKVGVVPFFWSSPTIATAAAAKNAASSMLQRVVGITETVSITAVGHPAQEAGDVVNILVGGSDSREPFSVVHLVDGFTLDCKTGDMRMATRSNALAEIGEA